MIHKMRLHKKYFDAVKNNKKIYEIRLLDEKRKKIKKKDLIEFHQKDNEDNYFLKEVEDLIVFKDFEELLNEINIILITGINIPKEELLKDFNSFYTKEEQEQYGIVAIKLKDR